MTAQHAHSEIRVFLVDDHAVVRRGMRAFIDMLPDIVLSLHAYSVSLDGGEDAEDAGGAAAGSLRLDRPEDRLR